MTNKRQTLTRDGGESPTSIQTRATGPTLRSRLIEQHGDVLGSVLFDAEIRVRRETAEKFQSLKVRLDALRARLDEQMSAGDLRLVPLEHAMNRTHTAWLDACAVYEKQRVANQSALVPLNEEIAALIGEINAPLHANRVKQWVNSPENGGRVNDGEAAN